MSNLYYAVACPAAAPAARVRLSRVSWVPVGVVVLLLLGLPLAGAVAPVSGFAALDCIFASIGGLVGPPASCLLLVVLLQLDAVAPLAGSQP